MGRRRCYLLTLAVVVCAVAAAVAQPDVTTLVGTIQAIDLPGGRFTLRVADGTLTELHASATFLTTLQPGDAVEVLMTGPNALIIRPHAEAPPPVLEEPQPPPSPDPREDMRAPPSPDARRHGE